MNEVGGDENGAASAVVQDVLDRVSTARSERGMTIARDHVLFGGPRGGDARMRRDMDLVHHFRIAGHRASVSLAAQNHMRVDVAGGGSLSSKRLSVAATPVRESWRGPIMGYRLSASATTLILPGLYFTS